jgi:cyclopropane-fatty-acyl-phospholipid synthase
MFEGLIETGYVPDFVTRLGARYMLGLKTKDLTYATSTEQDAAKRDYILNLKTAKIALNTEEANEQHYELPTRFFQLCLGKRLKYSSSLFERGAKDLDEAEEHMLELYCERAQLEDGLSILDLGCGYSLFYVGGDLFLCTWLKSIQTARSLACPTLPLKESLSWKRRNT